MTKRKLARWLVLVVASPLAGALGPYFCGTSPNGGPPPMQAFQLTLACTNPGDTLAALPFVDYGTVTGACGGFESGTCTTPTARELVSAQCIGQVACTIYPNTTTFGDPCFGTSKVLAVQAQCASGPGKATTVVPTPAPLPAVSASVTVDSRSAIKTVAVTPTLQVVSQHLLLDSSPIHDACWAALKALGAKRARYAPWFPYPKLNVAELDPPSGTNLCGGQMWALGQVNPLTLDCGAGDTIASVGFASFGTPSGTCGAYTADATCHDPQSQAIVTAKCVGQQNCSLAPSDFTSACANTAQYLAVQVACLDSTKRHTYWNFTVPDQMMLDFWNAVDGDNSNPIPNFSTPPTWMYDNTSWKYPDDPASWWYGYEQGTAPAANLTQLGDYYGRVLAWYTRGGFVDEYGATHTSGHALNISTYEVFNEVDYEHGHTPISYTLEFDAVVQGIRRWADPTHAIKFVGLSLPNIDDTPTVVEWATYFLNASNHAANTVDALNYIGYHTYPTNGGFTPDPDTFSGMFDYVDSFLTKIAAVDAVIQQLSPGTLTVLDEAGTDMDNVLGAGAPPANNPLYWVASGSYFAYLFSSVTSMNSTVRTVGQSQLMDAPGQEPSVTLLDWVSGQGTAKYWILKMLIDNVALGDSLYATTSNSSIVHAQGLQHGNTTQVLLINKHNSYANVSVSFGSVSFSQCTATVVDVTTGLSPPYTVDCSLPFGAITLLPYATAFLAVA